MSFESDSKDSIVWMNPEPAGRDEELRKVAARREVTTLEPKRTLCRMERCLVKTDGKLLIWDDGHLTPEGSAILAQEIKNILQWRISSHLKPLLLRDTPEGKDAYQPTSIR
jgi:hypothetical protein